MAECYTRDVSGGKMVKFSCWTDPTLPVKRNNKRPLNDGNKIQSQSGSNN